MTKLNLILLLLILRHVISLIWFSFCYSGGKFISTGEKIRLPDDVTMGYIIGKSEQGTRLNDVLV